MLSNVHESQEKIVSEGSSYVNIDLPLLVQKEINSKNCQKSVIWK